MDDILNNLKNLSPEMYLIIAVAVIALFPQLKSLFSNLFSSSGPSSSSGKNTNNAARLYYWEQLVASCPETFKDAKDGEEFNKALDTIRKNLIQYPPIILPENKNKNNV